MPVAVSITPITNIIKSTMFEVVVTNVNYNLSI